MIRAVFRGDSDTVYVIDDQQRVFKITFTGQGSYPSVYQTGTLPYGIVDFPPPDIGP